MKMKSKKELFKRTLLFDNEIEASSDPFCCGHVKTSASSEMRHDEEKEKREMFFRYLSVFHRVSFERILSSVKAGWLPVWRGNAAGS